MANFKLEKGKNGFYLTLLKTGLTSPSGSINISLNKKHYIRKPNSYRHNADELVVVGNHIVLKTDLYDFLCDEGEEVVSGPRRRRGSK